MWSVTVVASLMWNRLSALLRFDGHLGSLLTSAVEGTFCLTEATAGSDIFSERSRSMSSSVRLSVCRLSVTFVHPTQAIVFTPFGMLDIY